MGHCQCYIWLHRRILVLLSFCIDGNEILQEIAADDGMIQSQYFVSQKLTICSNKQYVACGMALCASGIVLVTYTLNHRLHIWVRAMDGLYQPHRPPIQSTTLFMFLLDLGSIWNVKDLLLIGISVVLTIDFIRHDIYYNTCVLSTVLPSALLPSSGG